MDGAVPGRGGKGSRVGLWGTWGWARTAWRDTSLAEPTDELRAGEGACEAGAGREVTGA